ncbi:hypothetical protein F4678DRAFT_465401 [Xylaria arbuscula]|nr:hypothetical protein F4678DRAFT_465401 [Xylaria arbuscula]
MTAAKGSAAKGANIKGYTKPSHGLFRVISDSLVPFAINIQPFSHNVDLVQLVFLASFWGL